MNIGKQTVQIPYNRRSEVSSFVGNPVYISHIFTPRKSENPPKDYLEIIFGNYLWSKSIFLLN